MNERLIELMKQATVREAYYPAGNDGHPEYTSYVSQEKFAELLIRECAKIAEKEQAYNDRHEIHVNIDQCILIEFGL